jgi:hypothetical protein
LGIFDRILPILGTIITQFIQIIVLLLLGQPNHLNEHAPWTGRAVMITVDEVLRE